MFILVNDSIITGEGELIFLVEPAISADGRVISRLRAVRSDRFLTNTDEVEARAALHDLAQRLYAHKWNSDTGCFVPVSYNNKTVGRVIEYMSGDNFPASRVDDVLYIVSLMNLCEESDQDVEDFLADVRAKDYFDEGQS